MTPRLALRCCAGATLSLGVGTGLPATTARSPGSIDAASRRFDDAQFRKDRAILDEMIDPSFFFIHGSGKLGDRSDFIGGFTGPETKFDPFRISDRKIIPLGRDAAVVTGDVIISGTDGGKPFTEHVRYSDTFVLEGGLWKVVQVQSTPVAE